MEPLIGRTIASRPTGIAIGSRNPTKDALETTASEREVNHNLFFNYLIAFFSQIFWFSFQIEIETTTNGTVGVDIRPKRTMTNASPTVIANGIATVAVKETVNAIEAAM